MTCKILRTATLAAAEQIDKRREEEEATSYQETVNGTENATLKDDNNDIETTKITMNSPMHMKSSKTQHWMY